MAAIARLDGPVLCPPHHRHVSSPSGGTEHDLIGGPVELLPNQAFVFPLPPAAPPLTVDTMTASFGHNRTPSGMRQRPVGRPLPNFTFNPAALQRASPPATTPPHSPTLHSPSTPPRPTGHRRGGSEFIGGDGSGGSGLMSTSPTKGDGVLPTPTSPGRGGRPAGRRGHAHRRSAAISCHDLSGIVNPTEIPPVPRCGSAPVSPSEPETTQSSQSIVAESASLTPPQNAASQQFGSLLDHVRSGPRLPPARARVGFSDRIEYIRPLSTVSSETESSISTIRGGHSLSGSVSSTISCGTASPQSMRLGRLSLHTALEEPMQHSRPSTAGAIPESLPVTFGPEVALRSAERQKDKPASPSTKTPDSNGSPIAARFPPMKSFFFGMGRRSSEPSLTATLPSVKLDAGFNADVDESAVDDATSPTEETSTAEKSAHDSRKPTRKQRKVKSWTHLIARKPKIQPDVSRPAMPRSPTPPRPASPRPATSSGPAPEDFIPDFDDDNTVTIVLPEPAAAVLPALDTNFRTWKPTVTERRESDAFSPVIDLDAALGPFKTPSQGPGSPGSPGRGAAASRRRMYSGGAASGGMQSHRRAESAPALVPFETRVSPLTSGSGMADVFEEEEDHDEERKAGIPPVPSFSTGSVPHLNRSVDAKLETVDNSNTGATQDRRGSNGLGIEARRRRSKHTFPDAPSVEERRPLSLFPQPPLNHAFLHSRDPSPVEVVEDFEEPRASSLTHSSDSTVSAPAAEELPKEAEHLIGMPLPLPQSSLMTPDSIATSFSSPDLCRSQTSLDTPRLGTAASSFTDNRTVSSMAYGEPGPDMRISVDDVPSLTSSRSTMTSALRGSFPVLHPRSPGGRSDSMISDQSAVSAKGWKRSSIASLSKLVGGSLGSEKSKLWMEQRPQTEQAEPPKEVKVRKTKRLSKLMQFWKSKHKSHA